jgi:hypothetical protein
MTPEGKIKKKLDDVLRPLRKRGVWYYKPQAGMFGASGIPDYILCVAGTFVGIECKADKSKKMTLLQAQCGSKIEIAGGKFFLVYDEITLNTVTKHILRVLDYKAQIKATREASD